MLNYFDVKTFLFLLIFVLLFYLVDKLEYIAILLVHYTKLETPAPVRTL